MSWIQKLIASTSVNLNAKKEKLICSLLDRRRYLLTDGVSRKKFRIVQQIEKANAFKRIQELYSGKS